MVQLTLLPFSFSLIASYRIQSRNIRITSNALFCFINKAQPTNGLAYFLLALYRC
jgi:hypothetical protein